MIFFSHNGKSDKLNLFYKLRNEIKVRALCENVIPLNSWTHIAITKWKNFIKFFINGTPVCYQIVDKY